MAWITPKTDWASVYDDVTNRYIGDYFNIVDYNRIKNNLMELRELATQLIYPVPKFTVGVDKHFPDAENPDYDNDNFFADELNAIEQGLLALDEAMPFVDFGECQTFIDNGRFIDYAELNRIESAQLKLYNILTDSIKGKLRLAFTLGMRGRDIRI